MAQNRMIQRLARLGKTQRDLAGTLYYTPAHINNVLHGRDGRKNRMLRQQISATILRWEQEKATDSE